MFQLPNGDYTFLIVRSPDPDVGFFIWEGETMPDKFSKGDGHLYEVLWSDEHVELRLVETTDRLRLLLRPILPIDVYVMTPGEPEFYVIRNRVRAIGREASRTDFEGFIAEKAPYLSVGGQNFLPANNPMPCGAPHKMPDLNKYLPTEFVRRMEARKPKPRGRGRRK